jgi:hypothetical protein
MPGEKERYCREFLAKHPACAMECRYYKECITWENYAKSMEDRKAEKKGKRDGRKPRPGLDAFLK